MLEMQLPALYTTGRVFRKGKKHIPGGMGEK